MKINDVISALQQFKVMAFQGHTSDFWKFYIGGTVSGY